MRFNILSWIKGSLSDRRAIREGERAIRSRLPPAIYPIASVTYLGRERFGEETYRTYAVVLRPAGLEPRTMTIGVEMHYGEPLFIRRGAAGRWRTLSV